MKDDIIKIELTTPEAIMFRLFQNEHDDYQLFLLLKEQGVFSQKNASVTLNFDSKGELQNIQRQDFMYSKRHMNREIS